MDSSSHIRWIWSTRRTGLSSLITATAKKQRPCRRLAVGKQRRLADSSSRAPSSAARRRSTNGRPGSSPPPAWPCFIAAPRRPPRASLQPLAARRCSIAAPPGMASPIAVSVGRRQNFSVAPPPARRRSIAAPQQPPHASLQCPQHGGAPRRLPSTPTSAPNTTGEASMQRHRRRGGAPSHHSDGHRRLHCSGLPRGRGCRSIAAPAVVASPITPLDGCRQSFSAASPSARTVVLHRSTGCILLPSSASQHARCQWLHFRSLQRPVAGLEQIRRPLAVVGTAW